MQLYAQIPNPYAVSHSQVFNLKSKMDEFCAAYKSCAYLLQQKIGSCTKLKTAAKPVPVVTKSLFKHDLRIYLHLRL